jgi:rRNA maturation RNase YbeY
MAVEVTSRRRVRGVRTAAVRRDARRLLDALGVDAELSVMLVGDAEMQRLNRAYRGKDRPTDVLSFEGDAAPVPERRRVLGDVVISLDTAGRQAAARCTPVASEVRTLLAHGVLHLLGYDHERSPADARRMFAMERALLRRLRRSSGAGQPVQASLGVALHKSR